jgi:hypothetical protein
VLRIAPLYLFRRVLFSCKERRSINKPKERLTFRDNSLGKLRGSFAAWPDLGQVRQGNLVQFGVDGYDTISQSIQFRFQTMDRRSSILGLSPFHNALDLADYRGISAYYQSLRRFCQEDD